MTEFIYPTETAEFQIIREDGMLYVDKTDLMYNLARKHRYVFLARPRRFGKSLLCNTFDAYFEGRKELFEGLKVMELEKEWKKHPVFHFDMSRLRNSTVEEAKNKLGNLLSNYENIYGKNPNCTTPGERFSNLIHKAAEQTGEKVVVILDEYDSPILRVMYDEGQRDTMRTILREFYQVLKIDGAYLRFVFITGITKFTQLSIFSELNNLNQISMDDEYSGICGITQEELDTVLKPCVEQFAQNISVSTEGAYALLKKNYDGYHFSRNSKDIYAPFSLLKALSKNSADFYWFESGTSSALIEHLRHFPDFNPLDCDGTELMIDEFDVPCEDADTPIPLLYQSGYLTIGEYNKEDNVYILQFPNREVRQGMVNSMTRYLLGTKDSERNTTILALSRALKSGNINEALIIVRSFIASIPYDIITKKEWMEKKSSEAFYKLMMYIIATLLDSMTGVEVKSIRGRADIIIQTKNDIFIVELKVDQPVDVALLQIDNMGYATQFESDPRPVTKCGVCISSAQRTLSHWRITNAQGKVIGEERFEE